MSKKKNACPYEQVTGKIDTIDTKLEKARCLIDLFEKKLLEAKGENALLADYTDEC